MMSQTHLKIEHRPDFLDKNEAKSLFERLQDDLAWEQRSIFMFGKSVLQPRLVALYGNTGLSYRYSGQVMQALPWTAPLLEAKAKIEGLAQTEFNMVLCNLYRDERDSMGMHADDEKELGPDPIVASVSLGSSRAFVMKHRHTSEKKVFNLEAGDLFLMGSGVQREWMHGIPKQKQTCGPRINLTFRKAMS